MTVGLPEFQIPPMEPLVISELTVNLDELAIPDVTYVFLCARKK